MADPDKYARDYSNAVRYGQSRTHGDFTRAIVENPREATLPLVYADWLDENGHPTTAGLIRDSVAKRRQNDPQSKWPVFQLFEPHPATKLDVPPNHPEGSPSAVVTHSWRNVEKEDGEITVGIGTLHRIAGQPSKTQGKTDANMYFGKSVPIPEAYRIARGLLAEGVTNADRVLKQLRETHPDLEPEV